MSERVETVSMGPDGPSIGEPVYVDELSEELTVVYVDRETRTAGVLPRGDQRDSWDAPRFQWSRLRYPRFVYQVANGKPRRIELRDGCGIPPATWEESIRRSAERNRDLLAALAAHDAKEETK